LRTGGRVAGGQAAVVIEVRWSCRRRGWQCSLYVLHQGKFVERLLIIATHMNLWSTSSSQS